MAEKNWYKSKTKIGGALIGIGALLGTVGGFLTGAIEPMSAIQAVIVELGAIAVIFGIRDLPFINK